MAASTSTFGRRAFGAPAAGVSPLSTGKPPAMFPGAIATDAQLTIAVDRLQTKLAVPLNIGDVQMTVTNGAGIVPNVLLTIDNEIVQTISGSGNVWTVQRGRDGTLPALHLASATVSGFVDAWHHNVLVSEVEAIEQALGVNLSNVGSSGVFNSGLYDFVPQTPGGALAPGLNVIPLAPVPRGVSGSNTKHYLYISGGTGGAEAVLIAGGSAVSGAPTGTVIVSCSNSHTGAWSIQSATKGIQEAEKSLPPEGGIVQIPTGNLQMRAPISYQRKRTFTGAGVSTRLIPASSTAVVFDSNLPVHPDSAYDIQNDDIWFQDFVIDAHTAGFIPTNGVVGIRHLAANYTEIHSIVGVRVDRVYFNNIRSAIYMHRVADVSLQGVQVFANSQIRFEDLRHDSNHNFNIRIDDFYYSWRTMDGDVAHPQLQGEAVLHFEFGELVYISNCQMDLSGGAGATGMDGIAYWGGGEDLSIVNTVIVNARKGIDLSKTDWVGPGAPFPTAYPGFVHMANVSMDQLWGYAVYSDDGVGTNFTQNVHNVEMSNCLFTNPHPLAAVPVTGVQMGAYAQHWQLSNVQMNGSLASNPFTLLSVGANAQYLGLNGVQLMNTIGNPADNTLGIFIGANCSVYNLDAVIFKGLTNNINDAGNTIPLAAALVLPGGRSTVYVTGSGNITSIAATVFDREFQRVTLVFNAPGATVIDGGNMRLAGNFVATAFSTLSLQYLSNFWIEISRSPN